MNTIKSRYICTLFNIHNRRYSTNLKRPINETNHYDIIVAGSGMIGSTLACTLGKNTKLSNRRILLLESSKSWEPRARSLYSNRVSALNTCTYNLLNTIDAWRHIAGVRYGQVKKLQVWDSVSNAAISFNDTEFSETIAYVVENDLLVEAVMKEIKTIPNVEVVNEAKIKSYTLAQDVNTVILHNDVNYTCGLLLGCDGANSLVRKAMGVPYLSWNYNQKAIVATIKLSEPTNNIIAWQRFLTTGPVALLPLTDNLSSLVWTTLPDQAQKLLDLSEEQFVDALNEALWKVYSNSDFVNYVTKTVDQFLDSAQLPSFRNRQLPPSIAGIESNSRAAFPLGFGHAANYVGQGVVLVGDAAHRVHPLAGQGVNLGFGDITTLNRILGDSIYAGSTLNNAMYLKQYETERQRHNVPTMLAVDGLQRLYSTDWTPVVMIRSLGLQLTHALNPLKKAIIAHAAQ